MALKTDYQEVMIRMKMDVDYITEEAYKDGVKDGRNEAWEVVKALFQTFGTESVCVIMKNDNVQGAIDRLKAYEEKQKADKDVKRGDVVRNKINGLTYIVTLASDYGYVLLGDDGNCATSCITNTFEKTGKHFDIDKILEEMKK